MIASSPDATIFSSFTTTFSKEISEHDCPSTVKKELIDTPSVSESRIIKLNSLFFIQEIINFFALEPLRTSVFVPFKILSESSDVDGDK